MDGGIHGRGGKTLFYYLNQDKSLEFLNVEHWEINKEAK